MIDVSNKPDSLREAAARGYVRVGPAGMKVLAEKAVPKGDPFEIARAAAFLAAKKTGDLIPHCHNVPLDGAAVDFELGEDGVAIEARVKAVWKTGVEMEALVAVSAAALTLYDLLKNVEKDMEIRDIRVTTKKGGKSDRPRSVARPVRLAVLVASDSAAAGGREDVSGGVIKEKFEAAGVPASALKVLPDDKEKIREQVRAWCDEGFDIVVTTGGTGLGPRDVTVEACRGLIEREIPGVAEAMRAFGQRRAQVAMLSRGVAGVRGKTLILTLPGSPRGVAESLDAILPGLLHVFHMMEGGGH